MQLTDYSSYAAQLGWWLSFFPPEQFLVLTADDLRDPHRRLKVCPSRTPQPPYPRNAALRHDSSGGPPVARSAHICGGIHQVSTSSWVVATPAVLAKPHPGLVGFSRQRPRSVVFRAFRPASRSILWRPCFTRNCI